MLMACVSEVRSSAVSTRVPTQAAKCELLSVLPPRHLLSHIPSLCSQHAPSTFLLPHTTASTFLLPHTTASTFTSRSTLLSHIPVFSHTLVRFFLCLHCMHLLHGVHHACWQLSIPPHLVLQSRHPSLLLLCLPGPLPHVESLFSCHCHVRSIYSGTVAGAREAVIQGAPSPLAAPLVLTWPPSTRSTVPTPTHHGTALPTASIPARWQAQGRPSFRALQASPSPSTGPLQALTPSFLLPLPRVFLSFAAFSRQQPL
ncbi:unnamed protein product, partial [Closterium sp. NIES-54]